MLVAAIAAVALLGDVGSPTAAHASVGVARASIARVAPTTTVRVAQFNCDISDEYPIIKAALVARAIRASGADVVGIEEGGGEIPQIAHALGWRYYDIRMQIVSRLPLVDPPGGNGLTIVIACEGYFSCAATGPVVSAAAEAAVPMTTHPEACPYAG